MRTQCTNPHRSLVKAVCRFGYSATAALFCAEHPPEIPPQNPPDVPGPIMATPKKTEQGTWRVQIDVRGVRESFTGKTRREAADWQARRRTELLAVLTGKAGTVKTLQEALRKYADEVSPTKRGEKKEVIRLKAFERQLPINRVLSDLTVQDLIGWRDTRLALNSRGSVLRDMTLLGSVLEHARREWRWIDTNPMRDVKRPANPDHRQRVISGPEIRGVLRALGYRWPVRSVSGAVAGAFLLALATGMRAGEICGLKWADVKADYVQLHLTKNGTARDVPLSAVAKRIIAQMAGWDDVQVFGIKTATLDALFRKARDKAGLSGFTFHDSRRNAATRISRLVDPLMLCRIFGWANPKMCMTYYAPSASAVARRL